ncbi:MAG: hypothetical protein ACJ73S_02185 [Mycobacteriales bacterium]
MRHRRQVFADPTGRRRRIAARAGLACAAVLVGYLLLLVTGLTHSGRYGVPGWHQQAGPTTAPTSSPTVTDPTSTATRTGPRRSTLASPPATTSPVPATSPTPAVTSSSPATHGRPTAAPGRGHASKSPGR